MTGAQELDRLHQAFIAKRAQAFEMMMDDSASDEERAIAHGQYAAWTAATTDIYYRIRALAAEYSAKAGAMSCAA